MIKNTIYWSPAYPDEYSFPVDGNYPVDRYDSVVELAKHSATADYFNWEKIQPVTDGYNSDAEGLESNITIQVEDLCRGISDNYLHKLLSNGSAHSSEVFVSDLQAATGTIAAVESALADKATNFHLGGGHHHAHRGGSSAPQFNLINDIILGLEKAKTDDQVTKTLTIDLDLHFADGTVREIRNSEVDYHLSLHQWGIFPCVDSGWKNYSGKGNGDGTIFNYPLPGGIGGESYMAVLKQSLRKIMAQVDPDLIIYQAGVDTHYRDQLGTLNLVLQDLFERDRIVLDETAGVPTIVLSGGGYGPCAAKATVNTLAAINGDKIIFTGDEKIGSVEARKKLSTWYGDSCINIG